LSTSTTVPASREALPPRIRTSGSHCSAVFSPEMVGYPYGSVQDPRVVKIEDAYFMTFAFRRFAWSIFPAGLGVPEASQSPFPGFDPSTDKNQTRSGIAVSKDRVHWEFLGWATPEDIDDRDVILFPEKIDGRFALLRRPIGFVDTIRDTARSTRRSAFRIRPTCGPGPNRRSSSARRPPGKTTGSAAQPRRCGPTAAG